METPAAWTAVLKFATTARSRAVHPEPFFLAPTPGGLGALQADQTCTNRLEKAVGHVDGWSAAHSSADKASPRPLAGFTCHTAGALGNVDCCLIVVSV